MPIGALEALACGVPQIVSRLEGMDEIVTPDTGILVEPKDVTGLADALIAMLSDDERRARAGAASVARSERVFQIERMVRDTGEFYAAVGGLHGRPRKRAMTTFVRKAERFAETASP